MFGQLRQVVILFSKNGNLSASPFRTFKKIFSKKPQIFSKIKDVPDQHGRILKRLK